jgi:hypothetical protein
MDDFMLLVLGICGFVIASNWKNCNSIVGSVLGPNGQTVYLGSTLQSPYTTNPCGPSFQCTNGPVLKPTLSCLFLGPDPGGF